MTDEIAGKGPLPFEPIHDREDVDALQAALQKLSEQDRQILLLRHFADMPFKDIARTLNCPIGTVLARAHRALGKLRTLMEVSGHEEHEEKTDID
jgi:RNA polymerase sigma-70 factor (ECF subfamily)